MRAAWIVPFLAGSSLVACGGTRYARERSFLRETDLAKRTIAAESGELGDEAFRADVPRRTKSAARPAEKPTETKLPNGVRLVTWVRHDFPSVSCTFAIDRGAAHAPPAAAYLYARALFGDSRRYDADDAWEYLGYVGADVDAWVETDAVMLRVTALTPLFVSAISRAAPMFLEPKLGSKVVDEARIWGTAQRSRVRDDAGRRADELLDASLFPRPHPYGAPIDGGDDAITSVPRSALEAIRDDGLAPEHVVVACAGDLDPVAMARTVDRYTSVLRAKPHASAPRVDPAPRVASGIVIVDRPGATQSAIALGYPGPKAADADRIALRVLDQLTTAGLSSRLNLSVRGELGATYGVHMRTTAHRDGGIITVSAAIDTPETVPALRRLLEELAKLRATPVSPAEMGKARVRASYVAETDQAGTAAGLGASLATRVTLGLPPSKAAEWARLDALDPEDVRLAAEKWLAPANARLVIVGDAARIEKDLASLGLGAVERR